MRSVNAFGLLLACIACAARATVFSGEVQVDGGQPIFVPPSNSSPVVLRFYAPDGAKVKAGDVILRIDAAQAEADLHKLESDMAQASAKNDKEIADLELKEADARLALADAQAERDTAAVDAAIPRKLISALDYDRHQSDMERTEHALALRKMQVEQATAAVTRCREDGALDMRKQQLLLDSDKRQVESAAVKATTDGTVVHDFDNLFGNGARFEEGSSSYPGTQVGQVIGKASQFKIRAWVLEPDRAGLKDGQTVSLYVDALPGISLKGTIRHMADAPERKAEWGDGRYFGMDIALDAGAAVSLKAGMSVRVDTEPEPAATPAASTAKGELQADGEVFAQQVVPILPPSVEGLWQMTVTQMSPDGEAVKQGDMVVTFDAGNVMKDLTARQSSLAEKQRKQEQLKLDLADREREAQLATAQAGADKEKAERKANQPKEYIAGVEYKKLIIARDKAETRARLTSQREAIAARGRAAEQRMADAEVTQLREQTDRLQRSLGALTVKAPRDGIVLHDTSWNGQKIDTGSQIWLGQSVAEMPDMHTLAVRATLPERDMSRVRRGQRVTVVIAGGGDRSLGGSIAEIGDNVHSKSRVEAVPVVDLVIKLDPTDLKLRPGQSVAVHIDAAKEHAP
ncbi:MAG TPA: HlyD family efflux transporter periplasmic adaptor subunit [Dyella sp.]|uniref:HlyD family secretion protein n=1 Tax=Dyella sp. TaxID=1869338 RepID=UPI002F9218BB